MIILLHPQPVPVLQQARRDLCNYHGIDESIEIQITRDLLLVMLHSVIIVNWFLKHLLKNWEMITSFYFKSLI